MKKSSGAKLPMSFKATFISIAILVSFILIWGYFTQPVERGVISGEDAEYAKMMGGASKNTSGMPTPGQVGSTSWAQLSDPFYDRGPNDKGIGIQLAYSIMRVLSGFTLAAIVAIPLGFLVGMSPLMQRALHPYIQVLKPISPLAWMPLALYTIKDAPLASIFVIFICSVWPMLINTAYGVASVKRDWLNVASVLEVGAMRRAFKVILPAAAPTILTGMRISMGIAWLVIVAAEMLVGGTGIGYFIWNEWNNLSLPSVIFAILMIGIVGMMLDFIFGKFQKMVSYVE